MIEQLLKEFIPEMFSSEDMQKYLKENISTLRKWQIINMIRKAFLSLERKREMFELLAKYETDDNPNLEYEEDTYLMHATATAEALEELKSNQVNEGFFIVKEYQRFEESEEILEEISEVVPCLTYENIMSFIKEESQYQCDGDYAWYEIEKYVKVDGSKLKNTITYYVFNNEVMYYENQLTGMGSDVLYADYLNLPVPFLPGDKIVCDGAPLCEQIKAVVLRVGDNIDCCSLVAVCERKNGEFESVPVKHSCMFYETRSMVYISPLYSMRYMTPEEMEGLDKLERISKFVDGDEYKGYLMELKEPEYEPD